MNYRNIFGRIIKRYSATAGIQPTIPSSSDHKDGTWLSTDIYEGEDFANTADARVYTRLNDTIMEYFMGSINGGCKMHCTSGTLTSGVIRTLNSVPVTMVAAQGAGKIISAEEIVLRVNFSTAAYSAVAIRVRNSTATINQMSDTNSSPILASTANRIIRLPLSISGVVEVAYGTSATQYVSNDSLVISAASDPTSGFSSIDYYLLYRIITL